MKVRDISLMAAGAMIAIAAFALAVTLINPSKAQAQASSAAPAPGGVSMIVSPGNLGAGTGTAVFQGGTIVMQDSVARKVTVVSYSYNGYSTSIGNTVYLSPAATFTY